MASAQDVLDAINNANGKLDTVHNDLTVVEGKLDTVHNDLTVIEGTLNAIDADVKTVQQLLLWGFTQLITLGQYTNQALFQNDKQNDTMICILQQVAVNTCGIWNEAHTQTDLQKGIEGATRKLAQLYAATHGDAAFTLEREEELRRRIETCCPSEPPQPVCVETPCVAPPPFTQQPPATEPPPQIGPPPIQ